MARLFGKSAPNGAGRLTVRRYTKGDILSTDFFKHKAESYEQVKHRVANVENIAACILRNVKLDKTMSVLDFGSGTGLLLEKVAPYVNKITAVDISKSMNQQLEKKREAINCQLEILELDLSEEDLDMKFDGIISSMTMHHVRDIESMFRKFSSMLKRNGFIAIADLDTEDGSYHTEDTGVFHLGFDRQDFLKMAQNSGFKETNIELASTDHKPQGDYSVFLLTGVKSS